MKQVLLSSCSWREDDRSESAPAWCTSSAAFKGSTLRVRVTCVPGCGGEMDARLQNPFKTKQTDGFFG